MKKVLSLFFIYVLTILPTLAVMSTDEVRSEQYIVNHGHSSEMARLMDLQNAQINGTKTKYKSTDPDWYTDDKRVNFVRKAFMYFDCGLDDGKFMQNDIKYTSRWDDL